MKKSILLLAATGFAANVFAQSATTQSTPETQTAKSTAAIALATISVSPNPFNNEVIVSFVVNDEARANISVFDILGNVIKAFDYGAIQAGAYNFKYETGDFKSGIYFTNIIINGVSNTKRIVKM